MSNKTNILPCDKDYTPMVKEPVQLFRVKRFNARRFESESNAWLLEHPEFKPISIACNEVGDAYMLYTIK
jgi:hypothetical protein